MPTHDAVKERPEFLTTTGGKYFLLTNGGPPNVSIIEHLCPVLRTRPRTMWNIICQKPRA